MTVLTTLALATGLAFTPAPAAGPHFQAPTPRATLDRLVAAAEPTLHARSVTLALENGVSALGASARRDLVHADPRVAAPAPKAMLDRLVAGAEPALRARSVAEALDAGTAKFSEATARECANARVAATLWAEQNPQTASSGDSIR